MNPTDKIPETWKDAIILRAKSLVSGYAAEKVETYSGIWMGLCGFAKRFYDNFATALPYLMGFRYHDQIYSKLTNKSGNPVTSFDDPENTVVFKTIPIMDVSKLTDLFYSAFTHGGVNGNFQGGKKFQYKNCIVDLNPDLSIYNRWMSEEEQGMEELILKNGQFPMTFVSNVSINDGDEYKTSKIVFTKIDEISGEKFDRAVVGSHSTDYDLVSDPTKRKYSDSEAVLDGA